MQLSIGFSSCPNDTFIFYALIHKKVETYGITFNPVIEDVEQLNRKSIHHQLDITKLSYAAFFRVAGFYDLLDSGSALGNNCGPLLITSPGTGIPTDNLHQPDIKTVAIPGKYTTANFLLSYAFPHITNKKEMLFSEIENAVLRKQVQAGVIIHETRFTYQEKGLVKIADLGQIWENQTHLPIPLGGIAVKKQIPPEIKKNIQKALKSSILYAFSQPAKVMPFVSHYAQEMQEEVMKNHIQLYVNDYSITLGNTGKKALDKMLEVMKKNKLVEDYQTYKIIYP